MSAAAVRARRAGFWRDLHSISLRAMRLTIRDPEAIVPALIIPVFFLMVTIGALQHLVETTFPPGFDFTAFELPVAVIFSVTGLSRAGALVVDVQGGYLDRLLLTPVSRVTILLGLMVADLVLVSAITALVGAAGLVVGVDFSGGVVGFGLFVLLGGLWGLAFTGFPYAIALRTGSPTAVNNSFLLFYPFAFLTTALVPLALMTGWLQAIARLNPTTYVLAGMRAVVEDPWPARALGEALLAIAIVGAVSFSLAFAALRGRVDRG